MDAVRDLIALSVSARCAGTHPTSCPPVSSTIRTDAPRGCSRSGRVFHSTLHSRTRARPLKRGVCFCVIPRGEPIMVVTALTGVLSTPVVQRSAV